MSWFRRSLFAALLVSSTGCCAWGATRVSLGAFGGAALSTGSLFSEASADAYVRFKQLSGPLAGGRLTFLSGTRIGLEIEGAMGGPPVDYYAQVGRDLEIRARRRARLGYGSLALLYTFYRPPFAPYTLYLAAGAGMTARGGPFFDDPGLEGGQLSPGFVAGAGVRYGIANGLHLRVDVRDHASLYRPASRFDGRWQQELVPSLGLDWVVAR